MSARAVCSGDSAAHFFDSEAGSPACPIDDWQRPEHPERRGSLIKPGNEGYWNYVVWVDVLSHRSTEANWIMTEGEILRQAIKSLVEAVPGLELEEIFVISPFRIAAERCRELIDTIAGNDRQPSSTLSAWAFGNIGTVHAFQGREARTVVVVLGGEPRFQPTVAVQAYHAFSPGLESRLH